MAIEITIPRLGWSMEEGVFSQWLKPAGEMVREGDALFELESDKAVQQVESFDSGILSIPTNGPKAGDVVKVGQLIGYLCRADESPPSGPNSAPEADSPAATNSAEPPLNGEVGNKAPPKEVKLGARMASPLADGPAASPSVRRLARQMGVDVRSIQGNQIVGRITAEDVLEAGENEYGSYVQKEVVTGSNGDMPARVSPRAARTAFKMRVDLREVTPTGRTGRIRERDVIAAASIAAPTEPAAPSAARVTPPISPPVSPSTLKSGDLEVPTSLRRTIASRMLEASQQTASVTLHTSIDATDLVNIRRQLKAATSADTRAPGFTDMLVKLSALALKRHPPILGQWTEQGVLTPHEIHIAVAVDTLSGLLTPVLREVHELSLVQISVRLHDLFQRTRSRRVSASELQGGGFTISNLGNYRIEGFTPILNLPQTAILGIGQISSQPAVYNGQLAVRDRMALSLTFDHRVIDGATAAAFLTTLCGLCESPIPHLAL